MVSFDMCQGNPGAMGFMMNAYGKNMMKAERAFLRMDNNGIRGSMLYMLWNDCCEKNTELAMDIMLNWPISKIISAINLDEGRGIRISEDEIEELSRALER